MIKKIKSIIDGNSIDVLKLKFKRKFAFKNLNIIKNNHSIPIIINNRNRLYDLQKLLDYLESKDFKQILDTSRMGSSIYYPFFWKGQMLGQLICGSQARNTYRNLDLELIKPFAKIASLLWVSHNGSDTLTIEK